MHKPPVLARVAAAYRAVPTACAMILAHMVMNRGQKMGQMQQGQQAWGQGKRQAGKAWQGKTRLLWQNGPVAKLTGTGLAVKQPADDPTGTGLAAKTAGR